MGSCCVYTVVCTHKHTGNPTHIIWCFSLIDSKIENPNFTVEEWVFHKDILHRFTLHLPDEHWLNMQASP